MTDQPTERAAIINGDWHNRQDVEREAERLLYWYGLATWSEHEAIRDTSRALADLVMQAANNTEDDLTA